MPFSGDEQTLPTPEQPPLHAAADLHQAPAAPPVNETAGAPARSWKPLARRVIFATLVGGTLTFGGMFFTLWKAEANPPAQLLGLWASCLLVMAAAGLALGLITALVMLAFKKPFGRSFANAYSLTVLIIAFLSITGSLLAAAVNRRLQVHQAEMEQSKEALQGAENNLTPMMAEARNEGGTHKQSDSRLKTEARETQHPASATSSNR